MILPFEDRNKLTNFVKFVFVSRTTTSDIKSVSDRQTDIYTWRLLFQNVTSVVRLQIV